MFKKITALLILAITIWAVSGCMETAKDIELGTENEEGDIKTEEILLPFENEKEFYFSSGVGGWGTILILNEDGSFEGNFHDSEMGVTGDGYPNGTCYLCRFSGKFENIEKLDDYTYSLTLKEISTEHEEGAEWIEDGVLYIASYPYGLDGGNEFLLYTPDCPVEGLSEDFLSWWPERYNMDGAPSVLNRYSIHNLAENYGFFGN